MSITAMKQALEALEIAANGGGVDFYAYAQDLRQAIAEAEKQEPVAFITNRRQRMNVEIKPDAFVWMPTTTDWEIPLYTTPHPAPQRTWVGLTTDELNMIGDSMRTWNSHSLTDVYIAIEDKIREKNT